MFYWFKDSNSFPHDTENIDISNTTIGKVIEDVVKLSDAKKPIL